MLAGVSGDYLTRLEQGRENHPSAQILQALSSALDLDEDARRHLFTLVDLVAPGSGHRPRPVVSPDLLTLLDSWPSTPAVVLSSTLDVLARNGLARALYSGFTDDDNLLRMVFLDPEGRRFYVDWWRAAEASVANLRSASVAHPADPALLALVEELRLHSAEFTALWTSQSVRTKTRKAKQFHHADAGNLTLVHQAFQVNDAPDQQLVVYQAEPATPTARALEVLGALAAMSRAGAKSPP